MNRSCPSQNAISVEALSKAYRLGRRDEIPDTLVAALRSAAMRPLRNLRRLRHLDATDLGDRGKDTLWALQDVSFDVRPGEVLGIVGRNGAGKSTLLKLLSQITEPTSGEAEIRGRVSSLLEVGTGFHPELTGRDNIYMNGTILGMTKREIDRKFDEIVDFSGVETFLDTPIKRYSSGMQVRLAFSVAANLDPEILIIDEVLAVGDAEFQRRCLGKMNDVAISGRTILFVSHNVSAIRQLCSSGLLLDHGRVTARGRVDEVLEKYMSDLFATTTRVGDDRLRLTLTATIDDPSGGGVWNLGSVLSIRVLVETEAPIVGPAVDLQLHSEHGRIAAAQSDRFVHSSTMQESNRWEFEFRITNTGIASGYVTIDAGFRFNCSTRYMGHWRSLAAVPVGPVPATFASGKRCPIALPCRVEIGELAA